MQPGGPVVKGRSAIEAVFKEKFEQSGVLELSSSESEIAGSLGFDRGRFSVASGADVFEGTYVTVFRRVNNEWKIAYHMHHMEAADPSQP